MEGKREGSRLGTERGCCYGGRGKEKNWKCKKIIKKIKIN